MRTLSPENAEILTWGGPGQEAWGHPLEKTAQYNHTAPDRKKPPICPWRIEVADPNNEARTLFLNIFEVVDEKVSEPTGVKFTPPAGVDIAERWKVRFNADGALGGEINSARFADTIRTGAQYQ